jgi:hypothetical protein
MTEYPLYPNLPQAALDEATALIEEFKTKLKKAADEAIGDLYSGILPWIESDSWGNFRNQIMEGLKNYQNRKIHADYDFKEIRQAILANHREDIVKDLNQDLVKEIEKLKEALGFERVLNRRDWK